MELIEIIGALGIGGIISSYFTLIWKNKQQDYRIRQELKEKRYKCIILLLQTRLDFKKKLEYLHNYGYSEISSLEDLNELLKDELINSYLFASTNFISALEQFIEQPNKENLLIIAKEIRKDLWNLKK